MSIRFEKNKNGTLKATLICGNENKDVTSRIRMASDPGRRVFANK